MAFRRKVYGQSQSKTCPFCDRKATQKNKQGLDVCRLHLDSIFEEIKCLCGSWLEIKQGKFGPFFKCINCGCLNLKKAMEINQITKEKIIETTSPQPSQEKPKEITITTDDVEYFD